MIEKGGMMTTQPTKFFDQKKNRHLKYLPLKITPLPETDAANMEEYVAILKRFVRREEHRIQKEMKEKNRDFLGVAKVLSAPLDRKPATVREGFGVRPKMAGTKTEMKKWINQYRWFQDQYLTARAQVVVVLGNRGDVLGSEGVTEIFRLVNGGWFLHNTWENPCQHRVMMSILPYALIPVLVLIYLGSFAAFIRLDRHSLRRYYRAAKNACRNRGWDIRDDTDPDGYFVIQGNLEGLSFVCDSSRIELDDKYSDRGYRPVARIIFDKVTEPPWFLGRRLQTHVEERITFPDIPGKNWTLVPTEDRVFDHTFELRVNQMAGQLPNFLQWEWMRRSLKDLRLECAYPENGKTVVLFSRMGFRDGTSDWHILDKQIHAARVLAGTSEAEKYRRTMESFVPSDEDWSLVPLLGMFASLIPAVLGSLFLDFPSPWMGAVTGAAAGWPFSLLLVTLGTWCWFRTHPRHPRHSDSGGDLPKTTNS